MDGRGIHSFMYITLGKEEENRKANKLITHSINQSNQSIDQSIRTLTWNVHNGRKVFLKRELISIMGYS